MTPGPSQSGGSTRMSYAAAMGGGSTQQNQTSHPTTFQHSQPSRTESGSKQAQQIPPTSSPSTQSATQQSQSQPHPQHQTHQRRPSQTPPNREGTQPESAFYILSLRTTPQLHKSLTALRDKHFPKQLNKLEAHIALFRALPGSELGRVEEDIERIVRDTKTYEVGLQEEVMKMGKARTMNKNQRTGSGTGANNHSHGAVHQRDGSRQTGGTSQRGGESQDESKLTGSGGVGISLGVGRRETQQLQRTLRDSWAALGFLSQQDQGGFSPHYTIQNKESDPANIEACVVDVERFVKGKEEATRGWAVGLELWRYERGWWVWVRRWAFVGAEEVVGAEVEEV